MSLPTGTVTFLFSDIEGSTQRWETHREAMASAVAQHDGLMRAACERHGGFVFKTVGDAFCVAFRQPEAAVAAALDAQRALGAEDFSSVGDLRVRMAIHTGTADERNGDFFGPAVNRVARLLGIGHGGQVLVSGTATDLLQGVMPRQSSLRDLGQHRLRDLSRPEQVYQLIAPGLPDIFPQPRSLDVLPNNLPRQATSFVGRDDVLAELKALLAKSQVMTIVGTGGIGKTRAALQIGADLLDGSGDGVWFVDFAPLAGAEYVIPEIALVLNVQPQQDRSLLDQVRLYLRNKRMLLILDNCEHVVAEVSRAVAAILKDCSQVKVLATSREGLNIHGEQVYRMPSLSIPSLDERPSAEKALRYGAIALFVARASAADARFTFTDDKAPIVTDICRRLDGIALAVELAASRVTILSVNQLSQRLDERFRLLTGGDRAALPRQQTMRAAIEWSYELLAEDEKTLFRRLSVFQGGWTLEASVAVCADEQRDEFSILEKLSSLASKSLIVVEFHEQTQRYRLLESLRHYGLELLRQRGEFDAAARRHAEYFAQFGQQVRSTWSTIPELVWQAQVNVELDNVRAALEWSLTKRNSPMLGVALAESLWPFWTGGTGFLEGMRWLEKALQEVDASANPALSLAVTLAITRLMRGASRSQLPDLTEKAVAAARALGDEPLLVRAMFYRAEVLVFHGQLDEAEPLLMETLELSRRLGDRFRTATVFHCLGEIYRKRGMFDRARELMRQGLQLDEAIGGRNRAISLIDLAYLEKLEGNVTRATDIAREAHAISDRVKDRDICALADNQLALYHLELGQLDMASSHARAALKVGFDEQISYHIPWSLEVLAGVAARHSDFERGARLIGYAEVAAVQSCRDELDAQDQKDLDWITQPLRDHLSPDQLTRIKAEGAAWTVDQAVEEALKV